MLMETDVPASRLVSSAQTLKHHLRCLMEEARGSCGGVRLRPARWVNRSPDKGKSFSRVCFPYIAIQEFTPRCFCGGEHHE
jgi:hypothetical protein